LIAARLYRGTGAAPVQLRRSIAREVIAGGAAIVPMTVAISVQPYLDAMVLSRLVPAEAVGWFGAARNISGTLVAPSLIIGAAAYPLLSRVSRDPGRFEREVRAALRPMLLLGGLAACGTWLFAGFAVGAVYGKAQFAPAAPILQAFAPGLLLVFADVLFGNALTALGRARAFSAVKVAGVALATALDLLLIPVLHRRTGNGGTGVMIAFVASEIVVFAGAALLMPGRAIRAALAADFGRALACAGITALLFSSLPRVPPLVAIPACVAAFALCCAACGLLKAGDLRTVATMLRRRDTAAAPSRSAGSEEAVAVTRTGV